MTDQRQGQSHPVPGISESSESPAALVVEFEREIDALHRTEAWERGTSARRLTGFLNFRVSLVAMKTGSRLDEHHNAGRLSVQTVRGHIRVDVAGRAYDLKQGSILILDRCVRHEVEALEESAFLLTIAFSDDDLQS